MFDEGRKLRQGGRKGRRNLKVIIHGEQPQSKSFSLSLPNTGFPRAPGPSPMAPTPSFKLWVISPIHPKPSSLPSQTDAITKNPDVVQGHDLSTWAHMHACTHTHTYTHTHTHTHIKKHGLASQKVTTLSQAKHSLFKGICPS